jgi:hypothetical protein
VNWEYYILSDPSAGNRIALEPVNGKLNEVGAQGWELVAAFPTSVLGGTQMAVYVFKRPVTTERSH